MRVRRAARALVAVTLAIALAGACARPAPATSPSPATPPPVAPASSATRVPSVEARSPPAEARPSAPIFIEDDYEAAIADARASHRLLFVDAWAPWCHSCVSLREYVLSRAELGALSSRLAFASIDTERPSSEPFLSKFPMRVWPTLRVIDPSTERTVLEWSGTATVDELRAILEATLDSVARGDQGAPGAVALVRGDRERVERHGAAAIAAYREAVASLAASSAEGGRARVRLVEALAAERRLDECVAAADEAFAALPSGTFRAYVATIASSCASAGGAPPKARASAARWGEALRAMAEDESVPLLADDRSDIYATLVGAGGARPVVGRARELAKRWAEFLEREAERAPSPAARAVFDYHRLLAYLALGAPSRAVPMLEASERDLPDDYDPPARLSRALLAMGDTKGALAAIDRALAKVYGPRALRVLEARADVLLAAGDRDGALATLTDAVRRGRAMRLTDGYARELASIEARRAALSKARAARAR